MKKVLLAAPLFALASCGEPVDKKVTCFVDISQPDNVTAVVVHDITGETLASAENFEKLGNGNLRTRYNENIQVEFEKVYDIPTFTIDFNDNQCVLDLIRPTYRYDMEVIGAELP